MRFKQPTTKNVRKALGGGTKISEGSKIHDITRELTSNGMLPHWRSGTSDNVVQLWWCNDTTRRVHYKQNKYMVFLLTRQTTRAWPIVNPRTNTILVRVVLIVYHKCMHLIYSLHFKCDQVVCSCLLHVSTFPQKCLLPTATYNQARTAFSGSNSRTCLATHPPIYTLPHEFCKPWAKP